MNKSSFYSLAIFILFPLILGALSGFFTNGSMDTYSSFVRPPLSPPAILFPIVWTILYIAMGISSWIIYKSQDPLSKKALGIYGIQLIINLLWPILFFTFHLYFVSFLWIVLLIFCVVLMILLFYQISPFAAYLKSHIFYGYNFAGYPNYTFS